jgi:outer membrane lipoprotein SlyB
MKSVMVGQIKWTESRGYNTAGWNICTLYIDGKRAASTKGGGYDMTGAVWGNWLNARVGTEINGAQGLNMVIREAAERGIIITQKTQSLYIIEIGK